MTKKFTDNGFIAETGVRSIFELAPFILPDIALAFHELKILNSFFNLNNLTKCIEYTA